MRTVPLVSLVSLVLACPALAEEPARPANSCPGIVFLVGGVGGRDPMTCLAPLVFPAAGVPHDIHDFRWTHGGINAFFQDLQDFPHMQWKAEELAAEVCRLRAANPDRPVYLIGRSGGAGLVLAAAERLPPQTIERIILLSPAVTPEYDLTMAFRATRGEIVSFWSPLDWLILSWGTRRFGTEDRQFTVSAGYRGFTRPDGANAGKVELYRRLVEIRWSPTMVLEGHAGGHLGTAMPVFLAREVAPWLMPRDPPAEGKVAPPQP